MELPCETFCEVGVTESAKPAGLTTRVTVVETERFGLVVVATIVIG